MWLRHFLIAARRVHVFLVVLVTFATLVRNGVRQFPAGSCTTMVGVPASWRPIAPPSPHLNTVTLGCSGTITRDYFWRKFGKKRPELIAVDGQLHRRLPA